MQRRRVVNRLAGQMPGPATRDLGYGDGKGVGGLGGVGGWDPGGNPIDPGFSGGTIDGRGPTGPNMYDGDGVFGGDLRDQGGWASIGGWQNAGDYLRGQMPGGAPNWNTPQPAGYNTPRPDYGGWSLTGFDRGMSGGGFNTGGGFGSDAQGGYSDWGGGAFGSPDGYDQR